MDKPIRLNTKWCILRKEREEQGLTAAPTIGYDELIFEKKLVKFTAAENRIKHKFPMTS